MRYDLQYIDNWSLWFDLQIMLRTLKIMLGQRLLTVADSASVLPRRIDFGDMSPSRGSGMANCIVVFDRCGVASAGRGG